MQHTPYSQWLAPYNTPPSWTNSLSCHNQANQKPIVLPLIRYPSDSGERWSQMNTLWGRGSGQIISNRKIKTKYLWELLKTGYEEGVQYHETRKSFSGSSEYINIILFLFMHLHVLWVLHLFINLINVYFLLH